MIDLANIEVRRHNGQCGYGAWTPLGGDDDVPEWLGGLVADEIAENDADAGRVEQGGSVWLWRKGAVAAPTTEPTMVAVNVMSLRHGDRLGRSAVRPATWEAYEASADPRFHWPEGAALAGDVFSEEALDEMRVEPGTAIWLERA